MTVFIYTWVGLIVVSGVIGIGSGLWILGQQDQDEDDPS